MSVTIETGSVIQVNAVYFVDGQTNINTFFYRVDGSTVTWPDDGSNIAAAFEAEVFDRIEDVLSQAIVDGRITVQPVFPQRYRSYVINYVVDGKVAADPLPSGVAVVCRRQGLEASRTNQGRIFVGGVGASLVEGSALNAAGVTAASGLTEAVRATLNPGGGALLLSPIVYNNVAPQTDIDVAQATVDSVIRYQRRRELRVGI